MTSTSILTDVKKTLNLADDFTAFDLDVMMHINSVLATLNQLGVGPDDGFMIEDADATWEEFLGTDPRYNSAKTVVYLQVRLYFDPPQTSHHVASAQKQIDELLTRLNLLREDLTWVAPPAPTPPDWWCTTF